MLGQPVIQFFPSFFVLSDTDKGKLRIFDTEDGDRIIVGRIPLRSSEFYTEKGLDTLALTSMKELVGARGVIYIREY